MANGEIVAINSQKLEKKQSLLKKINKDKYLILLVLPIVIYFAIFCYWPMYGVLIAFKDFNPGLGITMSPWVGMKWFTSFFSSVYFERLIINTLKISITSLIVGFPAPIIFALLLNEIKKNSFKRTVQTISYMPYFISLVVVIGLLNIFFSSSDGLVNTLLNKMGIASINFMNDPNWFLPIYIGSDIWQGLGWGSIIYLAALTGIDPSLYEAATIDGAGRWKQALYITIPGIMPTIIMTLILRLGGIMSVGFEKIILMYSPQTLDVADVISTYVYRRGILDGDFSFSTAVGLFNSIINFILLVIVNKVSKSISEIGIF